jgi:hypothetical protein
VITQRITTTKAATFLHVGDGDLIEFMGRANIQKEGNVYSFRLTDLAFRHVVTYNTRLGSIRIVNPVDTLLLKAILQRPESQGKHDLDDMTYALFLARLTSTQNTLGHA